MCEHSTHACLRWQQGKDEDDQLREREQQNTCEGRLMMAELWIATVDALTSPAGTRMNPKNAPAKTSEGLLSRVGMAMPGQQK